jgi:hypothetical protein
MLSRRRFLATAAPAPAAARSAAGGGSDDGRGREARDGRKEGA